MPQHSCKQGRLVTSVRAKMALALYSPPWQGIAQENASSFISHSVFPQKNCIINHKDSFSLDRKKTPQGRREPVLFLVSLNVFAAFTSLYFQMVLGIGINELFGHTTPNEAQQVKERSLLQRLWLIIKYFHFLFSSTFQLLQDNVSSLCFMFRGWNWAADDRWCCFL